MRVVLKPSEAREVLKPSDGAVLARAGVSGVLSFEEREECHL
jgi:hypothetical protein